VCLYIRLVTLDDEWIVAVAELGEVVVAGPGICADEGTWGHRRKDERLQLLPCAAWNDLEAQPSSDDAAPMTATVLWMRLPARQVRVGAGSLRAGSYLHCADDQCLVMDASALALGRTAHPLFVHFYGPLPADAFSIRADHRGPQLVEHLEGRLVAGQPEELLELEGRHPRGVACYEPRAPEPGGEGHPRLLHDRTGRQPRVSLADPTPEHVRMVLEPVRLTLSAAVWADDDRKTLTAKESFKAPAFSYENLWVFEKK